MYTEAIKTYYRAYFPNCAFNDYYGNISVRCLVGGVDWYLGIFGGNNYSDNDSVMYSGEVHNTYEKLSNLLQELKRKIGNN